MSEPLRVPVEDGKYTIVIDSGNVRIERGDILDWLVNPQGCKMLIAVAHELDDARRELAIYRTAVKLKLAGLENTQHARDNPAPPIDARVQVKLVDGGAHPTRATDGSIGLDLYARVSHLGQPPQEGLVIVPAGGHKSIPVGVCLEVPEGYEAQVRPRSGLAFKHGVFTCLGTIDQDYRGEIAACLFNFSDQAYVVKHGDRVAQLVIAPAPRVDLVEVEELSPTTRGAAGFGSTGK